jgi:hypothetical protein
MKKLFNWLKQHATVLGMMGTVALVLGQGVFYAGRNDHKLSIIEEVHSDVQDLKKDMATIKGFLSGKYGLARTENAQEERTE